ncbi:MAG: biosynthetic-type acetolactate synthase large subunit [Aurantibacter sp.]
MEKIKEKNLPTSRQGAETKKPAAIKISGAEAIVHCLLAEGVDLIYGYPGGAIMPVYDEFYKFQDKLTHILTRHEQGAAHAAQGFARVTGKVGVAIATSGPGATNLVTGLADAQIDSTPIVCITGQVPRHLLGSDAFQETDIIGISTPVTKWNHQITTAAEIPEVMAKAFYIAKSGRPGPVLIDITKNAQFDELDFVYEKCSGVRSYNPVQKPDMDAIKAAAELINNAKKPYIIWGQGVILGEAEEQLKVLVEKAGIPAAWTIMGASALPTAHPLNVGMVGMHGNYGPNVLTNECDVLLAIGMRFDDRVTGKLDTYATQAKVIHFEIDPAEINKNVKADIAVLGNSKETLKLLLPLINENKHDSWHDAFKKKYKIEFDTVIDNDIHPTKEGLTMGEVIEEINLASQNKAVIVTDVGQHQMIACRYAKFEDSKSNITSGGLGTMGFALPAAIGAKMGAMDREVVAIIGDGGYQMTIQELGVIFQHNIPIKIVVLNNDHLGMVRQWQELFFESRYASTVMVNPDFVKIAEGYHIKAKCVKERKDLKTTVQEMMSSKDPYFLEVKVEKEDNVFPMIPSGASVSDIRLK